MKRISVFFSFLAVMTIVSCSGPATDASSNANVPVTHREMDSESYKTVANLSISGMTCSAGCGGKIQQELKALQGVKGTTLDFADQRPENVVAVEYDPKVISEQEMIKCVNAIADGAYAVKKVDVIEFKGMQSRSTSNASDAGVSTEYFGKALYILNLFETVTDLIH